jgi:uncharacterized protein YodC (DUF2158 family)
MSEQKYKPGDVVRLKSGGPKMTVRGWPDGGFKDNEVRVDWFQDLMRIGSEEFRIGPLEDGVFLAEQLESVKDEACEDAGSEHRKGRLTPTTKIPVDPPGPKCPRCGEEATFRDSMGTFWDSNAHAWKPHQGEGLADEDCRHCLGSGFVCNSSGERVKCPTCKGKKIHSG